MPITLTKVRACPSAVARVSGAHRSTDSAPSVVKHEICASRNSRSESESMPTA